MSRIGKQVIKHDQVQIVQQDNVLKVKGKKGDLTLCLPSHVKIQQNGNQLQVIAESQWQGLYRSLIDSMVKGVTVGFEKKLLLVGVGYRAQLMENDLVLYVGFSHPITIKAREGIQFELENPTTIVIKGIDKQLVGRVAASIRALREPEVYKGKGIRYAYESIRLKAGKAGKASK
jgi:large subunit ribosomal protein L6|uniref:50S ribosomal protein L6 n=2 Tax=Cyanidioschyzon merolae TaxID=45157 RepID=Q85FU9_CYAM1|nr:ribosomal protein L6 [Cyanidioschyzon merolae strain 10D]QFV17034.1 50S ribosomal protein L6 [Cyanidioschyzon merolae]QFV17207.1 50S ribosomal protein L6 [Cyanidioschyzon merolae]BAC76245.1 50S ribosomal protein L6 [Cyanidioschyzon merolae strain 10D]